MQATRDLHFFGEKRGRAISKVDPTPSISIVPLKLGGYDLRVNGSPVPKRCFSDGDCQKPTWVAGFVGLGDKEGGRKMFMLLCDACKKLTEEDESHFVFVRLTDVPNGEKF